MASVLRLPSHADIHEFEVLWTNNKTQKRKEWHDGYLKWHTFNFRSLLYDEHRKQIGSEFFPNKTISSGMSLEFSSALVEIGDQLESLQANLQHIYRGGQRLSDVSHEIVPTDQETQVGTIGTTDATEAVAPRTPVARTSAPSTQFGMGTRSIQRRIYPQVTSALSTPSMIRKCQTSVPEARPTPSKPVARRTIGITRQKRIHESQSHDTQQSRVLPAEDGRGPRKETEKRSAVKQSAVNPVVHNATNEGSPGTGAMKTSTRPRELLSAKKRRVDNAETSVSMQPQSKGARSGYLRSSPEAVKRPQIVLQISEDSTNSTCRSAMEPVSDPFKVTIVPPSTQSNIIYDADAADWITDLSCPQESAGSCCIPPKQIVSTSPERLAEVAGGTPDQFPRASKPRPDDFEKTASLDDTLQTAEVPAPAFVFDSTKTCQVSDLDSSCSPSISDRNVGSREQIVSNAREQLCKQQVLPDQRKSLSPVPLLIDPPVDEDGFLVRPIRRRKPPPPPPEILESRMKRLKKSDSLIEQFPMEIDRSQPGPIELQQSSSTSPLFLPDYQEPDVGQASVGVDNMNEIVYDQFAARAALSIAKKSSINRIRPTAHSDVRQHEPLIVSRLPGNGSILQQEKHANGRSTPSVNAQTSANLPPATSREKLSLSLIKRRNTRPLLSRCVNATPDEASATASVLCESHHKATADERPLVIAKGQGRRLQTNAARSTDSIVPSQTSLPPTPADIETHEIDEMLDAVPSVNSNDCKQIARHAEALPIASQRSLSKSSSNSSLRTKKPKRSHQTINTRADNMSEDADQSTGPRLATQISHRAPDFMSANSFHSGSILKLDLPIPALGISAREIEALDLSTQLST